MCPRLSGQGLCLPVTAGAALPTGRPKNRLTRGVPATGSRGPFPRYTPPTAGHAPLTTSCWHRPTLFCFSVLRSRPDQTRFFLVLSPPSRTPGKYPVPPRARRPRTSGGPPDCMCKFPVSWAGPAKWPRPSLGSRLSQVPRPPVRPGRCPRGENWTLLRSTVPPWPSFLWPPGMGNTAP